MRKHNAQSIPQEISLYNGCNDVPTIVHEMMHAIGNFSLAFSRMFFSHVLARRSKFACETTM